MDKASAPLIAKLKTAGVQESEYTWYGLILGMLGAGFEEGSHQLVKLCQSLLNDDEPLPGMLTAAITSISLEAADLLKDKQTGLLQLPPQAAGAPLRLSALSDLVCGLEMGLSCDPKSGGMQSKISDQSLLETLKMFNEISQVDLEAECDEESLSEVTDFILEALCSQFAQHHKA
ncbi:MAG: hypothetical protein K6F05_09350 [Succinivibrio sp.]|nr:hypothetical protein [Succinivibrio sp.]